MLINQDYQEIRSSMQPGDIIAFGGNSLFSRWTKLTTRSAVTHVAVVMQSKMLEDQSGRFFNQVIEATTLNGKSGVMVNRLSDHVNNYDGDIWWLPLSGNARSEFARNSSAFFNFLFQQQHKDYDILQLFGSAVDSVDHIPLLREFSHNSEDFSSWFCSELVAEALEYAGVVSGVNASEVTPIDVCRFNIFASEYVQVKGQRRSITGYNSLEATGWGVLP